MYRRRTLPILRRRLQSKDDALFESAFWEVFLHEAYLRSGYSITIHPAVTGTSRRPDFLVEGDGTRFYVEAVRACAPPDRTGQARRLRKCAECSLRSVQTATYSTWRPMQSARGHWMSGDFGGTCVSGCQTLTGRRVASEREKGHARWPACRGVVGGWRLEFTAQPIRSDHVGAGLPLVRAHLSIGWAHDASRILTALDHKANRYGVLDAPLLIAVLNNPEFHADDLDVERALFGAMI